MTDQMQKGTLVGTTNDSCFQTNRRFLDLDELKNILYQLMLDLYDHE